MEMKALDVLIIHICTHYYIHFIALLKSTMDEISQGAALSKMFLYATIQPQKTCIRQQPRESCQTEMV